jgi:hypothetical protein
MIAFPLSGAAFEDRRLRAAYFKDRLGGHTMMTDRARCRSSNS